MSGLMFGGSALTLDVGITNDTGAALQVGSVVGVQLSALVSGAIADGFAVDTVDLTNGQSPGYRTIVGVVLGPTGTSIPQGEDCIMRVAGPCKARVTNAAAMVLYDDVQMTNGSQILSSLVNSVDTDLAGTTLADFIRVRGVALEAVGAPSADQLRDVWLRGAIGN